MKMEFSFQICLIALMAVACVSARPQAAEFSVDEDGNTVDANGDMYDVSMDKKLKFQMLKSRSHLRLGFWVWLKFVCRNGMRFCIVVFLILVVLFT